MRVLMLGWEFPPFITGGLGTACHGLTKALDRRGVHVVFALPKAVSGNTASHVRLLSPGSKPQMSAAGAISRVGVASGPNASSADAAAALSSPAGDRSRAAPAGFTNVQFMDIPLVVGGSYATVPGRDDARIRLQRAVEAEQRNAPHRGTRSVVSQIIEQVLPESAGRDEGWDAPPDTAVDYGGDLIGQVQHYARFCLAAAAREAFDVIHAHDWLTYPAGLALARLSGKPLVVHVHSTEFDRSGVNVNQPIYDIERRGMHGATKIIAVSQLTKNVIVARYGVHPDKVEVVYNGVDIDPTQQDSIGIGSGDKIVLYFGRITMQKGPEYFIRAAQRVLEILPDVKFVVAGNGDQAARMIEMAANLGIGHKVLFTGFLRGKDIRRVFALADVYVMPSVSEPFGIAPLEAISHDVPAIISKSSGVSEVLTHALKVDFWDVNDIADKIVAVLRHPPLSRTLREHGQFEVRKLTWDGAANRCEQIYRGVAASARNGQR
jgi:glycogen(starch) synthase